MEPFQLRVKPGRRPGDGWTVTITSGRRGSLAVVRVQRPERSEALQEAFVQYVAAGKATNEEIAPFLAPENLEMRKTRRAHRTDRQLHQLPNVLRVKRSERDSDIPF